MDTKIKYLEPLVNHLLAQNSPEAMTKALRDLLTPNELADVANRLQIIEMLQQGIPQRQIADKLGVGIATVTRGSHHLKRNAD
ncbi:MAG: trp operon repressor [Desulfuromonadales bacterium]|nr:trp operon repressor [Desulfuromonadales bacterium]